MFITAFFTIAKLWKQPKCPSMDKWIKKRWYISLLRYFSAIKMTDISLAIFHKQ